MSKLSELKDIHEKIESYIVATDGLAGSFRELYSMLDKIGLTDEAANVNTIIGELADVSARLKYIQFSAIDSAIVFAKVEAEPATIEDWSDLASNILAKGTDWEGTTASIMLLDILTDEAGAYNAKEWLKMKAKELGIR